MRDIFIVIPVLNPSKDFVVLVQRLICKGFQNIIVVNDGSNRECDVFFEDALKHNEVKVVSHYVNLGKGRALKTAINYILTNYEDIAGIITVDADGQHKIQDIIRVKEAMVAEGDKIIMGCRQFGKNEEVKIPFRSKFGNICTRIVLRYLCNIHITDTQTGLRGIPGKLLPDIMQVNGERYEYEMNMILKAVEDGVQLYEVPIETVYENDNAASHFNPLRDSLKIYMTIGKYSLASIMSVIIDNSIFIIGGVYTSNIWLLTFCGRFISAIFNFMLNKQIVFKKKGEWKSSVIKYVFLLICSGIMSALCVQTISSIIPINIIVIRLLVEGALFFVNFYFQKNVVFKNRRNEND